MVQSEEGATCTYKSLKIQHVANTTRCRYAGNTVVSVSTTYVLLLCASMGVCVRLTVRHIVLHLLLSTSAHNFVVMTTCKANA